MFTPVDMASSFFIERIGRQETVNKVIKIKTKPDAQVKGYGLTITFEYEDGKGNAYDIQENPFKEEELITISVSQPIRLETGDVEVPGDAYVGSQANISCEFYNLGKSTMYNMIVKVEGDFDAGGTSYFVGNMEAGRNDYYDASITPTQAGETIGKILFTFEDPSGNKTVEEKEFTIYVQGEGGEISGEFPSGEFEMNGEFSEGVNPNGDKNAGPVQPYKHGKAMGVGILVFVAVLFIFVRQSKIKADKKKELRF
jgi:hypothetical protein